MSNTSNEPKWVKVSVTAFKEILDNTKPEKIPRSKELIGIIINEIQSQLAEINHGIPKLEKVD